MKEVRQKLVSLLAKPEEITLFEMLSEA